MEEGFDRMEDEYDSDMEDEYQFFDTPPMIEEV